MEPVEIQTVLPLYSGARRRKLPMTALSSHSQLLPLLSSFSSHNTQQISILQSALDGLSHDLVSDKSLR